MNKFLVAIHWAMWWHCHNEIPFHLYAFSFWVNDFFTENDNNAHFYYFYAGNNFNAHAIWIAKYIRYIRNYIYSSTEHTTHTHTHTHTVICLLLTRTTSFFGKLAMPFGISGWTRARRWYKSVEMLSISMLIARMPGNRCSHNFLFTCCCLSGTHCQKRVTGSKFMRKEQG